MRPGHETVTPVCFQNGPSWEDNLSGFRWDGGLRVQSSQRTVTHGETSLSPVCFILNGAFFSFPSEQNQRQTDNLLL